MRILAVDDDPIILDLLSTVLEGAGYSDVVYANSGEQALLEMAATKEPFDCFLLDILMPGIDGVELCRRIRTEKHYAATPVIMVSRLDEKVHFDRAFTAGASDYVTKPFDAVELGVRLRLADQLQAQQRTIAAQSAGAPARKVGLSEAFMLDDVPGAIDNLALEAYLQRVSGNMATMQFFALKVVNAGAMHRKADADEYALIINSIADTITDVLAGSDFFISHAGNGVLSFVVHGRIDMTADEVTRAVLSEVGTLDFVLASGETVLPEAVIGTGSTLRFSSRYGRVDALRDAVLAAEEIATALPSGRAMPRPEVIEAQRGGFLERVMQGL